MEEKLQNILQSNNFIRRRVQESVNEFLQIRQNLLAQLKTKNLNSISNELAPLVDAMRIEILNRQVTSTKVQLALCGENSSGKTSFIHLLLGIGDILPADVGPITARIVKMTYADAENACAIIYPSLEDSFDKIIDTQIDLSSFFILNEDQDEPDWEGITNALAIHVKRPTEMDVNSDEFAKWAKHFIEIRLPSSTLKLGIDVYDTAGFRIRDAQILKDCLYNLVRRVQPTLVFLYDNPSSTDESNDCFLALKDTLKHLDSSNIFFLNTKADIDKMSGINKIKTKNEFIEFINNERIKRYGLLLKTPGMVNSITGGLPKSFEKCNCFDMCSVNSESIIPWGPMLNENAIHRLIQFVANSDLIMAQRVSNLVLPVIEAFFDLALITSHRTQEQLKELRRDAHQWVDNYFKEHREVFKKFLRGIFKKILEDLLSIKIDLSRRAIQQKNLSNIRIFIQLAIKQEVIKSVVYDALGSMPEIVSKLTLSNQNLMINATSNEILVAAVRTDNSGKIAIPNDKSVNGGALSFFMMQNITAPVLMVTGQLSNEDQEENTNEPLHQLFSNVKSRQTENDWNHTVRFDPLYAAQQYITEIYNQIATSENMFASIISTWCSKQRSKLQKRIDQQYEIAISVLPMRHQAHDVLQQYAHQFVRIECRLQAAQDLAKFNGIKPILLYDHESITQSSNTVYTIHEVEWGSVKRNLFVKRLTQPMSDLPNAAYLEAHYHRKINNLNIPHMLKLVYLYENQLSDHSYDLWMVFETPSSSIKNNLHHFIEDHKQQKTFISLKKALEIVIPIINALAALHENELVHLNVTPSNILFDEENKSILADLGDWCLTITQLNNNYENIIENRHNISSTLDGTNDDIQAFGQLGLILCAIINPEQSSATIFHEFKLFMGNYIKSKSKEPIKATDIRHALKYLYEKLTLFSQ